MTEYAQIQYNINPENFEIKPPNPTIIKLEKGNYVGVPLNVYLKEYDKNMKRQFIVVDIYKKRLKSRFHIFNKIFWIPKVKKDTIVTLEFRGD